MSLLIRSMITSSYGARAAWAVPKRAFSVASVRREESKPSSLLKVCWRCGISDYHV